MKRNSNPKRPTIAVIRGIRGEVIEFYQQFEKSKVHFIASSFKPFKLKNYQNQVSNNNFNFINLPFYFPLGFDPAKLISNYGNLSWFYIKDLVKQLATCDVINLSDTYYLYNLQAVDFAKKNNIPVVTVIWTTIPNHITSWFPPYSFITKKVVEATDLFILRSKKALDFANSLKISEKKIKVIYKGVNLDLFKPKEKGDNRAINILFVGNLTKAKGLDDLLAVFKNINRKHKNTNLLIAGRGQLYSVVEKAGQTLPIKFLGFISYNKLNSVYKKADIFCAPSKYQKLLGIKIWEDYFPYTLMEAMACGLPIVTTNSGGIPEEVSNQNLLIESGNKEALEVALEKLIIDHRFRLNLGQQNRIRAEKLFDAKIQAKKTESAILSLINS